MSLADLGRLGSKLRDLGLQVDSLREDKSIYEIVKNVESILHRH